eukprot:scaffold157059_cov56-Cyclotella_meneghiniana.AAC.1
MTRSLAGVIPFPLTMAMALEDDEEEGLRWFSCSLFHNNYRPVSKKETAMSCCRHHSMCQMHLKQVGDDY